MGNLANRSEALYQQALVLHANGQVDEAIRVLQQLIEKDRRYCPALNLLSILHQQRGEAEAGLRIAAQSLKVDARQPLALNSRGLALRSLGRIEEALASFERAIDLKPDYVTAWCNRGIALQDLKRYSQALTSYDRALSLKPDYQIAHFNRAAVLRQLKRHAESLAGFDRVLALEPDHFEALSGRAMALHDLKRHDEALASSARLVALRPNDPRAHREHGLILQSMRRYSEALFCCEAAISLAPDDAEAWCNKGIVCWHLKRRAEAIASYDHAISLNPDLADAHFDKGLLLLLQGRFEEGLPLYEWRWKSNKQPSQARNFAQPQWRGESLPPGTSILIHAEQGLGDTLQFCRYVPKVAVLGHRVILQAPAPLLKLLESLSADVELIPLGAPLPAFDWHCPLLSLPLAFKTTLDSIPAQVPYLQVGAEKRLQWEHRLGSSRKPRIGIAWSGSAANKGNSQRSIRFIELLALLQDDYEWHAIQKDIRTEDLIALTESGKVRTHQDALQDFSETAALVEAMDLIISVDSAPAHLAGALGKPVWILLPQFPDFRWLLDRTDSPWYPTATLFRQSQPDRWQDVLTQVDAALRERFSGRTAAPPPSPHRNDPAADFSKDTHQGQSPTADHPPASQAIDDLYRSALQLQGQGQIDESIRTLQRLLEEDSGNVPALALASVLHQQTGAIAQGLQLADRALQLDGSYALALNAKGLALRALNRHEEALHCFDGLIKLHPGYATGWCNRAMTLQELLRPEEAMASFDEAIRLKPDHGVALHNKALLALLMGRYREGWSLYEWRWRTTRKAELRNFPQPLWLGESALQGKTLLLHAEQGLGDTLHFARYVSLAAASGARVILEAPATLAAVLGSLKGLDTLVRSGDPLPSFDLHCPLMSAPLAFGTELPTIPADIPYLKVDADRRALWQARLGPRTRPRIGICWSGSPRHSGDSHRSLDLQQLAPLLRADIDWHVVQKDLRELDRQHLARLPHLQVHVEALADFADTAALIEAMDLVISADTAPAHLAGALGKTLWLMLPHYPDFRWLLDRDDSPWYPSASLFRQARRGDWSGVLRTIEERLNLQFPPADGPVASQQITADSGRTAGPVQPAPAESLQRALDLHGKGRIPESRAKLLEILSNHPDYPPALNLLSIIELQSGHLDVGLELIERSLRCNPQQGEAYNNQGLALRQKGDLKAALVSFDKAIECNPDDALAHSNRGVILQELNRFEESLLSHNRALALEPGNASAFANRGVILQALGRFGEAMESFDRALALDRTLPDVWFDKALLCLLLGQYEQGWKLYEWRWQSELKDEHKAFPRPLWLGEASLRGKTILLHHEQGLGDGLQFCRYVPKVAQLAARVILVVPPPLVRIMKSLPANCEIFTGGDALPAFDLHCPLMSLPLAFRTRLDSVPAATPYLHAEPARAAYWEEKLGSRRRPRIGIAWSGSIINTRDAARSLSLRKIETLLDPAFDWHIVQKDLRPDDRTTLAALPHLSWHGGELNDFADTAGLINALDLVISVDTSPAHLAGALGKPVWLLLPRVPDFRWLLDREDSPWYPSARLFRQSEAGHWDTVLDAVKQALSEHFPSEETPP